ncbi:MAG: Carbohydrate family 9 binding domain-like [Pseudomonadota bacterium]
MLTDTSRQSMLTPPSSQPARRVRNLRSAGAWLALPGLLLLGSCLFDLPALEPDAGIGGNAGLSGLGGDGQIAGNTGDPGGSSNLGGGAGVGNACPDGQKSCGESCQPQTAAFGCSSDTCEPCLEPPGTVVQCVDGQCAVTGCKANFADCDGDTIDSATVGNGCEYSLGPLAPTVSSLEVPFAKPIAVDGSRDDWSDVPAYSFEQVCANCRDQVTPPITASASIPPRNDLDGRFRVAWDGDFFYVFVEAFDAHLFDQGDPAGAGCEHGAECEDSVQVLLSGRNIRGSYGNDNHRIFLGLSNRVAAPGQGQPKPEEVEIVTQRQASRCYRLEAKIDWGYITATNGGDTAQGHFPPAANQSYGFDIALNDWDPAVSDATRLERQSQIFWNAPGPNFAGTTAEIGTMTLVGAADAGP